MTNVTVAVNFSVEDKHTGHKSYYCWLLATFRENQCLSKVAVSIHFAAQDKLVKHVFTVMAFLF